jgi:D-alanyl-D-alanine carboxypeptidase/D-alanyl-D-alanine-endopeptidase (penicillin-binding protein 4)
MLRVWPHFLALLLFPLPARAEEPTLAGRLETILKRPEYKHARWGILAVDAETGKPIYERNADQLFAPASVTKLYSCAAAMIAFGPDYRFETPVYQRGKLTDGKLVGDLILVAKGDLTMGGRTMKNGLMAFADEDHIYAGPIKTTTRLTDTDPLAGLNDLAKQVKAAGIKQVTGDVLIDTRLFDTARGSGSGPGIVTPIVINDNIVDVIVKPGKEAGDLATHELVPKTEFVQVDVQVNTGSKNATTRITTRRVGPQRWTVRGTIAQGVAPQVRICPVDDPAGFARALFLEALRREGVSVPASALQPPTAEWPESESYSKLTRVALYRSPPLSEALKVTLKVSHNLYASTLPVLLAVKNGKRTQQEGMRLQGQVLAELGVKTESISLESGAGGGDGDKVSPRATVELLAAMRKRPDWPTFEAALPILGVDGTLATVVKKDSPARGKVMGKTGTYTDDNLLLGRSHLRAKSLAGVMTTAQGKSLVFAIFVNDVALPKGMTAAREGRVIGELCEVLQQHGR